MSGRIDRLLKQRDEFNALYEKAPGFVVALEGSEHRFTFVNASYKRLVGREDLIGRRIADAVPEIADQGLLALLDRVFQTGEPFVANSMPVRSRPRTGAAPSSIISTSYTSRSATGAIPSPAYSSKAST
jgi:PAS domain-containing protein